MRLFLSLLLGALLISPVCAKLYKWVDANGNVQYSDTPPASRDRSISVLSNQGTVKDKMETAEEKNARMAQEKAAKEEAEKQKAEQARDNYLLSSYSNTAQIEKKKQEALAVPRTGLNLLVSRKNTIQESINKASDKRDKDALGLQLNQVNGEIANKRAEMNKIIQRFNADIARFKELKQIP